MKSLLPILIAGALAKSATGQNEIAIDLTTDQYGSESFWQIDGGGGSYFLTGSGFPDQDAPGSYPQATRFVDLADGVFNFCLGDAFDDGFCCAFGQGSITIIHVASGTVLFYTDTFSTDIVCTQLQFPLGRVQGQLFLDDDHDCQPGASETVMPGHIVQIFPGPVFGLTDATGHFDIPMPNGTYTVGAVSTGLYPICPPAQPVPVVVTDEDPFPQVLLGDSSTAKLDLMATAASGPARPGFQVHHSVFLTSTSIYPTGPVTATITLDPLLTFISAEPPPDGIAGNLLTWSLPALEAYEWHPIHVHSQLPPDPGLIGEEVEFAVEAHQTLFEPELNNNQHTVHTTITGSFDPNDKLVWPEDVFLLDQDSVLDYTIRFQNTGTDTAFTVVVTDTLSEDLDMASFQQGAASHPFALTFKPGRVLEWRFANIIMPDSNVNESASHGIVGFRIKPHLPLAAGTEVVNAADIFFDFNPPVRTPDARVVAETSTGVDAPLRSTISGLAIYPNPAQGRVVLSLADQGVIAEVRLFTVEGRLVRRQPTALGRVELDLGGFPAGTYLVAVRTNHGNWLQGHFSIE